MESTEHRNNLLMLLRMLYDLSYGKLKDISNEIEKQQPSIGQRSGYNVPLEGTEGRPKFVITREQLMNLRETGMTWAKVKELCTDEFGNLKLMEVFQIYRTLN